MGTRKRQIRVRRGFTFALAIVLTLVIAVIVFQKSGVLSYQLSKYINNHYFKDTPFSFSCGRVSGDLVGHVSVARPVIRYDGDDRSLKVFAADQVLIDYDLLEVLKLKMMVSYLGIEGVRISIWNDEEGRPILPIPAEFGAGGEAGISPHVEVERFSIQDLEFVVETADTTYTVERLDVSGSLSYVDGRGELDIDHGQAHLVESDTEIQSLRAEIEFAPGAVDVKNFVFRLDESFVMVSGRYENGRFHHVQGVFNPLNLEEVSSFGVIDEKGDIGGSVVVDGVLDSLRIKGSVTGRAAGLVFSGLTLEGLVTPEAVHLDSVQGQVFGARVNGELTYRRDTGSYTFDGQCQSLDVSHGFLPGKGIPEMDLNGGVFLHHDGIRKTYEIRTALGRSSVSGFESEEVAFNAQWDPGTGLAIREVIFRRPGFVLAGFGTLDNKDNVDLIVELNGDDLDYLMDYLVLPPIDATATLSGRLFGPLDGLQLNLNGQCRDLSYIGARIDSSRVVAEARGILGDNVTASLDIDGRHLELFGRRFSDPHVRLEASDGAVDVRDFSFSMGDTFITADFNVLPEDSTAHITLKHLGLEMSRSTWRNSSQTTIVIDPTSTTIDTLRLESNGHSVGVVGSYSTVQRLCDLNFWGDDLDLALLAGTFGVPIRIEGTGEFRARIHENLDNPNVDLTVRLVDGVVDSLRFDRLEFDGRFSGDGYRVDYFCIHDGVDSLTLNGSWACRQSPIAMVRFGVNDEAAMSAPITIKASSQGYPIASILKAAHREMSWDGTFSGEVSVGNTARDPEIVLAGVVSSRSGTTANYRLPNISTNLSYTDGVLHINSVSFNDGKVRADVSGRLPVTLDLRSGFEFNRSAPADIKAIIKASDLAVVSGYIDAVAASAGRLDGVVEISGAANDPRFTGEFNLNGGGFRVAQSNEVYQDIKARVEFEGNSVKLVSLTGRKGKKGRFTGDGWVKLDGFKVADYDFGVDLDEFPFSMISGFESTQDGRLTVRSQANSEGRKVPALGGKIKVRQGVITRSLATQEGPPTPLTMPVASPRWLCHLEMDAPKNVWVKNPDLQMELGGDLVLKRDQTGLYLRGDLSVLRGSYSLYNNKFRITDGRFDFATATTLRPGIYLDAYTPHGRAGEVERRIFLSLAWPADETSPKISLSYSEPGYSEADIWAMLGGQVVTGSAAFTGDGTWDAGETATTIASNYLERMLNAQMMDYTIAVENRPIGRPTGAVVGESELSIAVGRYFSEDLYLNYRQGLKIESARAIDVEYRLSNMLLLRSEIIKYSQKGIQGSSRRTTDEINFDIKFRYEY